MRRRPFVRVITVAAGLWLGCSAAPSTPPYAHAAEGGAKKAKEKVMLKTDDDFLGAYKAHLGHSSKQEGPVSENKQLRKGDWRYFFRGAGPGDKHDEAAVSASGELIDKGNQP